jgi:GDP-L-fucose synthase
MTKPIYELSGKRIWVAGHRGMVGRSLVRRLHGEGCEIITTTREQVDLRRQQDVEGWMRATRPQAIILAAATVGGILANDTRPAEFLYDNLAIEVNVIEAARQTGVEKLLFLGSSCIYPREPVQPIREDALLTGSLEPTNQWYAIAKIAGIMLCQAYRRQYGCDFISAMPTNLYGPGDTFDLQASHVVPALMAKAHAAKQRAEAEIVVWGTGAPRRELMYVDDLSDALVFLLKHYSAEQHVNIGTGVDITIRELAETVASVIGVPGKLRFDPSKPDGAPRKLLDTTKMRELGWSSSTNLEDGLRKTYQWFLEHAAAVA